jgi:proteasome assembly chaperone (PAC2) family protein
VFKHLEKISCDKAILLIAFKGWSDAAEAATSATDTIISHYQAHKFASFEEEEFFAFARERPNIKNSKDGRIIEWPNNDLFYISDAIEGTPLIILNGTEPHFKWKTFSSEVINLCQSMNVQSVVTLGALLDSIPHTRGVKTQITGQHEFMPEVYTQKKIDKSRYEGPTGITSVIIEDFKKIGIPSMSIWAHAPHYLQSSPNPIVSEALLNELSNWLPLNFDVKKLKRKSDKYLNALESAITQDSELKGYIEKLEKKYDSALSNSGPIDDDLLLKDLEKFFETNKGNENGPQIE